MTDGCIIVLLLIIYVGVSLGGLLIYVWKVFKSDFGSGEIEVFPHCLGRDELSYYRGSLASFLSREMDIIDSVKRTSLGMVSLIGLTLTMSYGFVATRGIADANTYMTLGIILSVFSLFILLMALLHPVGISIIFSIHKPRDETKTVNIMDLGSKSDKFKDTLVIYEMAVYNDTREQRRWIEIVLIAGECITVSALILIIFAVLSCIDTGQLLSMYEEVMSMAIVSLVVFFIFMYYMWKHTSTIAESEMDKVMKEIINNGVK